MSRMVTGLEDTRRSSFQFASVSCARLTNFSSQRGVEDGAKGSCEHAGGSSGEELDPAWVARVVELTE